MHLIVPFAAPLSAPGHQALRALRLPRLQALLARWRETARDDGDEWSLSPPHERAFAAAVGWHGGSGQLPLAAHAAQADGIDTADLAWGLVTPSHWQLSTEQISLLDPAGLMLDAAASRLLFEAVLPLFTSEGFVMQWGAPLRWYLAHESLQGLATASLDRVIGRGVNAWLGGDAPALRRVRRLQNEVQMLLYTHAENERREAQGLLPVNSFWLSGCGVAQPARQPEPRVDDRLRGPALAEDWAGWLQAWQALDEGPLAELQGQRHARLTLCGERSAVSFAADDDGDSDGLGRWWRRLSGGRRAGTAPQSLLEGL